MRFYPARVSVYYTWRDVGRQAVRAEKLRVFGAATRLEMSTDTPIVELVDGGRTAVSRFRKRYVIEGRTRPASRRSAAGASLGAPPRASVEPDREKRGGTIDRGR
jgi:hypothetical protein